MRRKLKIQFGGDAFGKLRDLLGYALILCLLTGVGPVAAQDQGTESSYDYAAQTLRVGVWLEGKEAGDIYRKAESLVTGFQTNEDAYAVVYRIDTAGRVSILWPRSRYDDGFVFGGHEYLLPVSGARQMHVSSMTGEGFVEALVSSYPFDLRNLEIDFHHESTSESLDFQVAGDPFLAINEINYAITGLEDATDYVVTNYISYYVHQEVDHPRYLCDQCHFEEDVAYDPYRDVCTLDIQVDYGWGNTWYDTYGYYPSYWNPVYVYVDPWSYRPWINFWYDPWYSCPTMYGYRWNYSSYVWCDSPYYGGNSYGRYPALYSPAVTRPVRKTQDYAGVSRAISRTGVAQGDRDAVASRTVVADRGSVRVDGGGRNNAVSRDTRFTGGDKPMVRTRPDFKTDGSRSSRGGLQIRDTSRSQRTGSRGEKPIRHTVRETEGSRVRNERERSALVPVGRTGSPQGFNRSTTIGGGRPASGGTAADKPRTNTNQRNIKPVEPRKKGTRVWNSGRSTQENDRNSNATQTRSRTTDRRANSSSVRTRSQSGSGGARESVKSRSNTGSSRSSGTQRNTNTRVRSNSGSKSNNSGATRSGGSGGSKSSNSRSSGRSSGSRRDGGRR